MDERTALDRIANIVPDAGDDAAVVDGLVITTDMLHEQTDFPAGVTAYTAGWRSVATSLSDVAAMAGKPVATVAAYGAPTFEWAEMEDFIVGAQDVSDASDAQYVGGDLDHHEEFTVATTAIGRTTSPISRTGASPGEVVCVTGTLGRSGAALRAFEQGAVGRGNALFRFEPRVAAGLALAPFATAMMDSSDGLALSLHQLANASDCGFEVESPLPIDSSVDELTASDEERLELGCFTGEDFELVCTVPPTQLEDARDGCPIQLTSIGEVVESGITLDGDPLSARGFIHE